MMENWDMCRYVKWLRKKRSKSFKVVVLEANSVFLPSTSYHSYNARILERLGVNFK